MNGLKGKISNSCKDHLGKDSATRINAYIMTALIGLIVICFLGIEVINAIDAYKSEGVGYTVSTQLVVLVTLLLGHQALLLNLKRKSEDTSFPTVEILKEIEKKEEETI
jgi:hypothetical protein